MNNTEKMQAYYAAINTRKGFLSFFEDIFYSKNIERRYIIKGGPGTGKSSLMKKLAARAENAGKRVDYYYCSSDTSSLDGIIIDAKIAFLDGTAPHTCDTVLPGVVDEIIDLGRFWNAEYLKSHSDKIIRHQKAKRVAYDSAYKYLCAAGDVLDGRIERISSCINKKKLEAAIQRICAKEKTHTSVPCASRVRQTDAFGVRGRVHLDTLSDRASSRCAVKDYYGSATIFLDSLVRCAERMGIRAHVSLDTVDPTHISEAFFCDSKTYFYICEGDPKAADDTVVNMKRFVDNGELAEQRQVLRALKGTYDVLLGLARESLASAGSEHEKMERIYMSAMDFDKVVRLSDELWDKIT